MQKAGDDFTPHVDRGQRGDQRRRETAETVVVWLITQRRTVRSADLAKSCRPPRCSMSRPSPSSQGQAAHGRFVSLDTAATARGTVAIEEDGGGPGHGHQYRLDRCSPGH
jgi:hypothetical protein